MRWPACCPTFQRVAVVALVGGAQGLEGGEGLGAVVQERQLLKDRVKRYVQLRDVCEAGVVRQARQVERALGEVTAGQLQRADQRPGRRHGAGGRRLAPGPRRQPDAIGPLAQQLVGVRDGRRLVLAGPGIEQDDQGPECQRARRAVREFLELPPRGRLRGHAVFPGAAQAFDRFTRRSSSDLLGGKIHDERALLLVLRGAALSRAPQKRRGHHRPWEPPGWSAVHGNLHMPVVLSARKSVVAFHAGRTSRTRPPGRAGRTRGALIGQCGWSWTWGRGCAAGSALTTTSWAW